MIFRRNLGLAGVIEECGGGRNEGRPTPRWWQRLRPIVVANLNWFPPEISVPALGAWIEQETDGRHTRVSSMGEVGLFQLHLDEIGALIGHRTDNIDKSSRPWKPIGPVAKIAPQITGDVTTSVQWGGRLLSYYDKLLQRDAGPIQRGTHLWHGLLKAMHWAPQARFWVPHVRNALAGNLPQTYDDFAAVMTDIWEGRLPYAPGIRRPTRPIECAPIWVLKRAHVFVTKEDALALKLLAPTFAEGLLATLMEPEPLRRHRPPSIMSSLVNPTGLGAPPPVGVRLDACARTVQNLGECIPIDWWRQQVRNGRPQGVGFGAAVERGELAPFARVIPNPRTDLAWRKHPVWGVTFHTTGSSPLTRAERSGRTPLEEALDIYRRQPGPTYLIDWYGNVWAITPDERYKTHHTRITPQQAEKMRWGSWIFDVQPMALKLWQERWNPAASPLDLFPGVDPKEHYVGIEMIPVRVGSYHPGPAAMRSGLKFTKAQHDAAAELARSIAERHRFPGGWSKTGRFTGHEDLNPADRDDARGGWDPGSLRIDPYFDREYVQSQAEAGTPWPWLALGMAAFVGVTGALWYRSRRR